MKIKVWPWSCDDSAWLMKRSLKKSTTCHLMVTNPFKFPLAQSSKCISEASAKTPLIGLVRAVLTTPLLVCGAQPRGVYLIFAFLRSVYFIFTPTSGVYISYSPLLQGCIFYIHIWFSPGVYILYSPFSGVYILFSPLVQFRSLYLIFTPGSAPCLPPIMSFFRPQSVVICHRPHLVSRHIMSHQVGLARHALKYVCDIFCVMKYLKYVYVTYRVMPCDIYSGMPWNMFVTYIMSWNIWNMFTTYSVMPEHSWFSSIYYCAPILVMIAK